MCRNFSISNLGKQTLLKELSFIGENIIELADNCDDLLIRKELMKVEQTIYFRSKQHTTLQNLFSYLEGRMDGFMALIRFIGKVDEYVEETEWVEEDYYEHRPEKPASQIELYQRLSDVGLTEKEHELVYACGKGNIDKIKQLLQQGINMNVRDSSGGLTPLMFAAIYGHDEAVNVLLQYGAHEDIKSSTGFLAIELAANNNHLTVVSTLARNREVLFRAMVHSYSIGHDDVIQILEQYITDQGTPLSEESTSTSEVVT